MMKNHAVHLMNKSRIRSILEAAINLAIVIALSYTAYTVWKLGQMVSATGTSKTESGRPEVNSDQIAALFASTRSTGRIVVVAMSQKCGACKANLPFLRELAQGLKRSNHATDLVLLFPNEGEDPTSFVDENGLSGAEIGRISFRDLGLLKIPILAIREQNGAVSGAWIGSLDPQTQGMILKAMKLST
jgi:hypothetical protein